MIYDDVWSHLREEVTIRSYYRSVFYSYQSYFCALKETLLLEEANERKKSKTSKELKELFQLS